MKKLILLLALLISIFVCGCQIEFVEDSSTSQGDYDIEVVEGSNDIESSEDVQKIEEDGEELDYDGLKASLTKGDVPEYVYKVTVDRVVDGDTMKLKLESGEYIRIRTLLIDTPEDTKEKQYLGDVATAFAKERLQKGDVAYIETDGPIQDDYDRYLGYLWYEEDGEMKMYNEEILKAGLARVAYIKEGVRHLDRLYDAQYEAKDKKLNVWSIDGYVTKYGFDQSLVK